MHAWLFPSQNRSLQRKRSGFTLVELLAVIAIIAILAVAAGSMFTRGGDYMAQKGARVASILSLASQTAKSSNRPIYAFVAVDTESLPNGLRFALVADVDGADPFGSTQEAEIGTGGVTLVGAEEWVPHVTLADDRNDLYQGRELRHRDRVYSYSLKFLPTGQVEAAPPPAFLAEIVIGLRAVNASDGKEPLLVKVAALTGMQTLTRP